METITQSDPAILMQVEVKDSVRRHLKAEAAKAGKTMGNILTDLLREHGGYEPPEPPSTGGNKPAGSAPKPMRRG